MTRLRRARIAVLGVLAGTVLFAALAPAADAGVLVASAPSCDNGATEQSFAPFGDTSQYFLVPGGDFEAGAAGWNLGGSAVVSDQEPWHVHSATGSHALSIPAGRTTVSPTVCVGIEHPTMRFFAHRSGGGLLAAASQLVVTARVETSAGAVVEIPVGAVNSLTNGTSWDPTLAQVVVPSLLPLLPGQHTPIQFRFTSVGTAAWVIDDVFVDPHCRG
jgi:hypothetical protein